MSNKKLHLESLRGVAALSVVFYHYSEGFLNRTYLQNGFTENAGLMVDFFFVLSGYVIALSYGNKLSTGRQVLSYQWKRFLRLYPLHLVMLLAFLALQIANHTAGAYGFGDGGEIFGPYTSLKDFISNLFLTQNFTGAPSWNRPSWSISAEFYTYLVFALCMLIYVRLPRLGITLAVLVVGLSAYQIYQTSMHNATGGYVRCFMSFFIGAFLVKIERSCRIISSELLAGLVLLGTVAFVSMASSYSNEITMLAPILYSVMILLLNALPTSSTLIRVLSIPSLVFLGTVSYGIYMIHEFVGNLSMSVINHGFNLPLVEVEGGNGRVLNLDPVTVTLIEILIVAIVICLAHLSYKYLERPALKFGRGRSEGTRPPITINGCLETSAAASRN